MTKRIRTILFFACLLLFFLIAPAVVFYSQGYRIDINPPAGGKKITQTGGLFLKVWPKQADIYLNEKFTKKTDFFFGSVLIENLLPKKYQIKVEKTGFLPWEKNLEVREREVAEVKNVILFPENINFNILIPHQKNGEGIKNFWFSPNGKKIILQEKNPPTGGKTGWALKLYDLEKNIKSHLIEEGDISRKGVDLFNLEFSENSKEISLELGVGEEIKHFSLNLEKTPLTLTEIKVPPLPLENIITHQTLNNDVYYLDSFGYLFKTDSSFAPKIKINEIPFPISQETEYKLIIFPDYFFLEEGQTLYQFNPESKSFEKFFEGVQNLKISPDLKKLVYFSNSEIWILFLKEKLDQPQKKAGEKLFLIRLSEKISDCFWLNSDYLVFNAGGLIKISEIDDRDRINIYDIAVLENPEIFFNKNNKKLYILSNENLFESPVLVP